MVVPAERENGFLALSAMVEAGPLTSSGAVESNRRRCKLAKSCPQALEADGPASCAEHQRSYPND